MCLWDVIRGSLLVSVVRAVSLAPCDQTVVGKAFNQGFFTHVLMQCVADDPVTEKTISGDERVDPAVCLALFITKFIGQPYNPLDSETECLIALETFVGTVENVRPSLAGFTYSHRDKSVDFQFDYDSWSSTFGPKFLEFADSAGATMGSSLCTGYQVRDLAKEYVVIDLLIAGAGGTPFNWPTFPENDYCSICYAQFLEYLSDNFSPVEQAACNVTDVTTTTCLSSATVLSALIWFNTCAGFPITFTGPLCSTVYVSKIEAYLPYYTITSCLINSDPAMCMMMGQLFDVITANSDVTCRQCYVEFVEALNDLLLSSNYAEVTSACSGSWDAVGSTKCIQVLTDILANFSICAGVSMDTTIKVVNINSIQSAALSMIK
jgi:hypothetical protein